MFIFNNKYVSSFFNFIKFGFLIAIISPFINYAALNREKPVLFNHGLHYDIGYGQNLFLSCKGKGFPTVVAEAPIGVSSDIWIPLQEKLSKITKICIYDRSGLGMSDRPVDPPKNNTDEEPVKARVNRGMEFTVER
jgi:hypothetical protein